MSLLSLIRIIRRISWHFLVAPATREIFNWRTLLFRFFFVSQNKISLLTIKAITTHKQIFRSLEKRIFRRRKV